MKKSFLEANARRRTPKGFGGDAAELFQQGFEEGAKWMKRTLKKEMKKNEFHLLSGHSILLELHRWLRSIR